MTVCKILIMLDSVSGPKPVCLQQVTVHLDLESLKLGRCWRSLQDGKRKGVPGSDSSVGECPEDRVIGAHRQGERELERMGCCQWTLCIIGSHVFEPCPPFWLCYQPWLLRTPSAAFMFNLTRVQTPFELDFSSWMVENVSRGLGKARGSLLAHGC